MYNKYDLGEEKLGGDKVEAKAKKEEVPCFDSMLDEELVISAREGDKEALEYIINKYKNFVRAKARSYFFNRSR